MTRMTVEESVTDESLKMGEVESIAEVEHPEEIFPEADEEHVHADYSKFSKHDFVELVKGLSKDDNFKKIDDVLKEVKPLYNDIRTKEKATALEVFLRDGGVAENFEYKSDEFEMRLMPT